MATKRLSTSCGDWHLGWGLSGNDKIGKLSTEDKETFTWKGWSQGRHGQKWNKGAEVVFTLDGDNLDIISQKGSIPRRTELLKGVKTLMEMKERKPRVKKVKSINNQTKLEL